MVASYLLDWLILRDVLNTACNIISAAYKEVSGWEGVRRVEGVGRWVNVPSGHS